MGLVTQRIEMIEGQDEVARVPGLNQLRAREPAAEQPDQQQQRKGQGQGQRPATTAQLLIQGKAIAVQRIGG